MVPDIFIFYCEVRQYRNAYKYDIFDIANDNHKSSHRNVIIILYSMKYLDSYEMKMSHLYDRQLR